MHPVSDMRLDESTIDAENPKIRRHKMQENFFARTFDLGLIKK
jgi:hypothetical protein